MPIQYRWLNITSAIRQGMWAFGSTRWGLSHLRSFGAGSWYVWEKTCTPEPYCLLSWFLLLHPICWRWKWLSPVLPAREFSVQTDWQHTVPASPRSHRAVVPMAGNTLQCTGATPAGLPRDRKEGRKSPCFYRGVSWFQSRAKWEPWPCGNA